MKYLKFKSQYNKYPSTKVENHIAICGYEEIAEKLNEQLKFKFLTVADTVGYFLVSIGAPSSILIES